MSSEALVEGPNGVLAAWETRGQVKFARIDAQTGKVGPASPAPGSGSNRKHPALGVNSRGEALLAWTEGTGWSRGGDLAWQLYDASGKPVGETGRLRGGIPKWGLPAVAVKPDGSFLLLH